MHLSKPLVDYASKRHENLCLNGVRGEIGLESQGLLRKEDRIMKTMMNT